MKHPFAAKIAVALLSTVAASAFASTAQAALSGFQIQLIDLDPSDGIAPSVTFQDLQGGPFVAAESGTRSNFVTDSHAGGGVFGPASSTSDQGGASAFSSLSGDPFGAGANATASASTNQRGTYGASTVHLGDGDIYMPFTLSPETRIVITADASASVMSTFDDAAADTWASIFLKLTDATGLNDVSEDSAVAEQFSTLGGAPSATTDAHRIDISFENLASTSAGGIFFGSVDAYSADISPASEPAGLALMAAGLGVLAWRRRQLARKP